MATAAARRYAKAIFELATQDRQVEEWSKRLARISEFFSNPEVASALANPSIPTSQREALVAASPHLFDTEATNLARLMIESGRIDDAVGIEEEYQRIADEAAGRIRATVTTAIELEREGLDRVARELSLRLEKEVRLTAAVDPRIIGGLKLQYGDRVIDASVATRLQQLRRRLAAT